MLQLVQHRSMIEVKFPLKRKSEATHCMFCSVKMCVANQLHMVFVFVCSFCIHSGKLDASWSYHCSWWALKSQCTIVFLSAMRFLKRLATVVRHSGD